MDAYVKRRLELNDQAGISLSKKFYSLAVESGGFENLTYTEWDYRNYIAKQGNSGLELETLKHLPIISFACNGEIYLFFLFD